MTMKERADRGGPGRRGTEVFIACPECSGDGCDSCCNTGGLIVPSKPECEVCRALLPGPPQTPDQKKAWRLLCFACWKLEQA